ncbi:MAG: hypothetical protein ABH950_02580 [Candidatus Altiarchaeota archaeon]
MTTMEQLTGIIESEKIESPAFIYDAEKIGSQLNILRTIFRDSDTRIYYSYKTNPSLGKLVYSLGCGLQVTSLNHLNEVLKFADSKNVIFCGRTLSDEEIRFLIGSNVHIIANSINQIERIRKIEKNLPIGIRIDTGITSECTGFNTSNLGLGIRTEDLEGIEANIIGIHNHIASQIVDLNSYRLNAEIIIDLADKMNVSYINIGGGFPIQYGNIVPTLKEFADAFKRWKKILCFEPGRILVGPAGVLFAQVKDVQGDIATIDASVFNSVRDRILSKYKIQLPVLEGGGKRYKVVGNTPCSVDYFGQYELPCLKAGSKIFFSQAGAYCRTKDDFSGTQPPSEYILNDGKFEMIK